MSDIKEFTEALAKVNVETTRIGVLIKELVDKLAGGGLSAEQEAEVLVALRGAGTKLEGIGADVVNPAPDPV